MATLNEIEHLHAIEDEAWLAIRAAEAWHDDYQKTPKQFANLIKSENRLRRALSVYFHGLPERAMYIVNWNEYRAQAIKAFEVVVDIDGEWVASERANVFRVLFNDVLFMVAQGAISADVLYTVGAQMNSSSLAIQKAASTISEQLAKSITDYSKQLIIQSISDSLKLGEDLREATDRLTSNVGDFDQIRAERIARTESVRAYSEGITEYGKQSGATGQTWRTSQVGVCPICKPLHNVTVPIGQPWESDIGPLDGPPGHPNCRCYKRLEYKAETPTGNVEDNSFDNANAPSEDFAMAE